MSSLTDADQPWGHHRLPATRTIFIAGARNIFSSTTKPRRRHPAAGSAMPPGISPDVIEEAKGRGLKFPLLVRFQDILRHRVESINLAFLQLHRRVQLSWVISASFAIKGVNGNCAKWTEENFSSLSLFNLNLRKFWQQTRTLCRYWRCRTRWAASSFRKRLQGRRSHQDEAILGLGLGFKVIMVVEKLEELAHIITLSKQLCVSSRSSASARA